MTLVVFSHDNLGGFRLMNLNIPLESFAYVFIAKSILYRFLNCRYNRLILYIFIQVVSCTPENKICSNSIIGLQKLE